MANVEGLVRLAAARATRARKRRELDAIENQRRRAAVQKRTRGELEEHGFVGASQRETRRQRLAEVLAVAPAQQRYGTRATPGPKQHRSVTSRAVSAAFPGSLAEALFTRGDDLVPIDPVKTARSGVRQVEEALPQILPSLAILAKSLGTDLAHIPTDTARVISSGGEYVPRSETYERVAKPVAEFGKYLATPGPVVARVDENGRPVYRKRGGGETRDPQFAESGIAAKIEEGPLDYALLGRGALMTGGRAAALVKPELGAPGRLELRARTGETFSTRSSTNPVRRAEQESLRAATTGLTGALEQLIGRELPVVGEHARAIRLGSKQQRRAQRAQVARNLRPFQEAVRPLSVGEKLAVVLRAQVTTPTELRGLVTSQRDKAANRLEEAEAKLRDRQVPFEERKRIAKDRRRLVGEISDHDRMLTLLEKTSDQLYRAVDTDPKLQRAYVEADRISGLTGDILETVGKLNPEVRAVRPYLTARVVRGARYEETPARKGRAEQVREYPGRSKTVTRERTLEEAKTRLAELDETYEALVGALAERLNPYADQRQMRAEQLRRNQSAGRRARGRAVEGRTATPRKRKTVSREVRDIGETKLLELVERNPRHPVAKRASALIAERQQLREALNEHALSAKEPLTVEHIKAEEIPAAERAHDLFQQRVPFYVTDDGRVFIAPKGYGHGPLEHVLHKRGVDPRRAWQGSFYKDRGTVEISWTSGLDARPPAGIVETAQREFGVSAANVSLIKQGDLHPLAPPPTPRTGREGVRELYRQARAVGPAFAADLQRIGQAAGARVQVARIKKPSRSVAKVEGKYGGDASRLKDVVRGRVLVRDAAQLRATLDELRRSGRLVTVADKLTRSGESGYRDVKAYLDYDGHIAEVQITFPEIVAVREQLAPLYKQWRSLPRNSPEAMLLQETMRFAYDRAYERLAASNSSRETGIPSSSSDSSIGKGRGSGSQATAGSPELKPPATDTGISPSYRYSAASSGGLEAVLAEFSTTTSVSQRVPDQPPYGTVTRTIPGKPRRVRLREVEARKRSGGIVGGPDVDRLKEELGKAIWFPHTGEKLRQDASPQAQSGRVPPRVPGMTRQNRAVRLLASRWLPSPDVWSDAYVKAVGYSNALARGVLARNIAKPLNEDGSADRGWYYVNLGATDPPPARRKGVRNEPEPTRAQRERPRFHEDLDDFLNGDGDLEGFLRERLVSKDNEDVNGWIQRAHARGEDPQIAQISPEDYRNLFGDFQGSSKFVQTVIDKPTNFWRTLTLTYRPAWVVNNIVGQTLLYAVNNAGHGATRAYAQAAADEVRRARGKDVPYFPEDLRFGLFKSEQSQLGTGPQELAATAAYLRRAERAVRDRIQRFNAAASDNVPRRAAWYTAVERNRKLLNRIDGTNRKLAEFLDELERAATDPVKGDKRMRQLHDEIVQEVLDELIDFNDLSAIERRAIRRAIPFYSWLKGITKATVRLGLNKPLRAEFLLALSQAVGEREAQKWLGLGSEVLGNVRPAGPPRKTERGVEQDVIGFGGMNPYQTVSDVAGMARGGLQARSDSPFDNPANALNPLAQSLIEGISRRDLFTGAKLEVPGGIPGAVGLQLARSVPAISTLERIFTEQSPTAGNGRARLSVPNRRNELLSYAGVPIRRKNLDRSTEVAEEARARKQTPAVRASRKVFDNRAEMHELVRKHPELAKDTDILGEDGRLAKPVRDAWNLRASYKSAYQRRGITDLPETERPLARFRLAAELMVRSGQWTKQQAAREIQETSREPVEEQERRKNWLLREPLKGYILEYVGSALRDRGEDFSLDS